jgi:hypothetical protein
MRDRLIRLINHCTSCEECRDEDIADHLLANGVIVPPCKVGDTVYSIVEGIDFVLVGEVYEYVVGREHFVFRSTRKGYFTLAFTEIDIGKTVFLTRGEAEKALAKRSGE